MDELRYAERSEAVGEGDGVSSLDLLRLFRKAGGSLAAQIALHGELFRVEWAEERRRLADMALVSLAGFACLQSLLLFFGALAVATFWNSHRIAAFAAVLVVYGAGLLWAWRRLRALAALGARSFAATREELAADLNMLRTSL